MTEDNIKEGSATISSKSSVFYNKIQEFNRDLSICAINAWHLLSVAQSLNLKFKEGDASTGVLSHLFEKRPRPNFAILDPQSDECRQRKFTVLEGLSATGLRSIRYANELYNVSKIVANDLDSDAVDAIQENIVMNNVQDRVESNKGNALHVLYQSVISNNFYNVIDLDPFGSSSMFLDGAVQAVSEGGLLCITCTDMAVLAGGQSEICWSKYGGVCIRGTPFCHELGIRLLLHTVATCAARYKRVIEPLLCCSIDYYVRIFVRVKTKPEAVKLNASQSSILYYCGSCKNYASQPMGKHVVGKNKKGNDSHKYSPGRGPPVNKECEFCASPFHIAGPFYNGTLHNSDFLDVILRVVANSSKNQFGSYDRMVGMLSVISEEIPDIPFYYCIPTLNNVLHCNAAPQEIIISAILNGGYRVSETHMGKYCLKTDAPMLFVWDVLKQWAKENHPITEKNLKPESPAFKIYHMNQGHTIDFSKNPNAIALSRQNKLVRHQINPTPNWGPKSRPSKRPRDE